MYQFFGKILLFCLIACICLWVAFGFAPVLISAHSTFAAITGVMLLVIAILAVGLSAYKLLWMPLPKPTNLNKDSTK